MAAGLSGRGGASPAFPPLPAARVRSRKTLFTTVSITTIEVAGIVAGFLADNPIIGASLPKYYVVAFTCCCVV
jgi:hypothetical protein